MAKSLQEQVEELCIITDKVIEDPSKPIETSISELGVDKNYLGLMAATGAITGACFCCASILLPTVLFPIVVAPGFALFSKLKRQRKEKEMMYRKIIAKQQIVIKELKKRDQKREEEIKHLEEMMEMLINMQDHINNAA